MELLIICLAIIVFLIVSAYVIFNQYQKVKLEKKGYRTHFFVPPILSRKAIKNGNKKVVLMLIVKNLGPRWTYESANYPWLAELKYETQKGEVCVFFPWQTEDCPEGVIIFYKKVRLEERMRAIEKLIDALCFEIN